MSLDEAPLSTHAASQAWFSMMLANDPNTALVASLRPPRHHSLWAALRRPFARPTLALETNQAELDALRPRSTRWIGGGLLLALSVALAGLGWNGAWPGLGQAPALSSAARSEPVASLPLPAHAPPPLPVNVAGNGVQRTLDTPAAPAPSKLLSAVAPSLVPLAADAPRAETKAAPSPPRAKKKPRARLRRELDRALTGRRAPR